MTIKLTPGSAQALDQGCTCPVLDNGHGAGWCGNTGLYVISMDCPLHRPRPRPRVDPDKPWTVQEILDHAG